MVNNLDWTAPLSAIDLLRDIGKHFRVNKMLSKDAVSARLQSDAGISYTEFSYQVLQAIDYLELYRRHGCTLQTGGSDQWGNLTAGLDLIHRVEGVSAHALATPLVTKADGTKFGKTEARHGLARPRDDVAVRLLPVLGERRRPRRRQLPQILQHGLPRGDRGACRSGRAAPVRARGAAGARRGADHPRARAEGVRRPSPGQRGAVRPR